MSFTSTLALAVQTTFAKQLQQLSSSVQNMGGYVCVKDSLYTGVYGRVCVCEGLTVHWCVWEGVRV